MRDQSIPLHKRCGKCQAWKPVSDFARNRARHDGLQHYCKPCACALAKARYVPREPRRIQAALPGFKRCSMCQKAKLLLDFNRSRNRPDGRHTHCRSCQRVTGLASYHRHADRARQYRKANREQCNARALAWRRRNPEKVKSMAQRSAARRRDKVLAWREANRDRMRAANVRWYQEHPLARREYNGRRQARIRDTRIEPVSYRAILDRDGYRCHICGGVVDPSEVQFDHVIPLARGGPHTYDNIKVAHAKCNFRKHTSIIT